MTTSKVNSSDNRGSSMLTTDGAQIISDLKEQVNTLADMCMLIKPELIDDVSVDNSFDALFNDCVNLVSSLDNLNSSSGDSVLVKLHSLKEG